MLHFLRPYWFAIIIPFIPLLWLFFLNKNKLNSWTKICDANLLPYLIQVSNSHKKNYLIFLFASSILLLAFSLAGPTWSKLTVPTFKKIKPRIVLLDMSEDMLTTDLSPNRLSRAKFKLHDLFQKKNIGQIGLIAYTAEPFVVSPLTDDAKTIDALLPNLTPDIMPVEGNNLVFALDESAALIKQAGFNEGEILILTAKIPTKKDLEMAEKLSKNNIFTSVLPIMMGDKISPQFKMLARSGNGLLIKFSDTDSDINYWLAKTDSNRHFSENYNNELTLWRDEGRWFLLPVLFLLLPMFRRGML